MDQPSLDINKLYISSSDSLRGIPIDQTIAEGWNDRPPLFVDKDNDKLLKGMVRKGIPPALRCAVWISSIIKSCHSHQEFDYSEEYRTLGKARALDHAWSVVLKQTFPDSDIVDVVAPNFGNSDHLQYQDGDVPPKGQRALERVLCAIGDILGVEYAPLLPTLAALCLRCMSESYAFYALREMALNSPWYMPKSQVEHHAWCRAFAEILGKLHPQTAVSMKLCGALNPEGLDPILKYFFLPILRYEHVLRIMDIFTYEGGKVIFRFGIALLCLFRREVKNHAFDNPNDWWQHLRRYTHSPVFKFEVLVRKAYGFHGNIRERVRFPRRHILARIIRLAEEKVMEEAQFEVIKIPPRPLGLVENEAIKLAKSSQYRANLASWMPISLRLTKMDLVYSTDVHGRTLELFYRHVKNCKHTFTLCEVLNNKAVIGMFASQAWRVAAIPYGDGECFMFRLDPDSKCWRWRPDEKGVDEEEDEEVDSKTALLEQFMVGTTNFISMGANEEGMNGFRLNEDLTEGTSAPAVGFHNDPLPGLNVFEVGLVEVYRLVRAIDEKTLEEVAAEAFKKVI